MSGNAKWHRKDWLVLLTGGLASSSAIGWLVYRDFKSVQLDSKAMTIAATVAGGIGIYVTGSVLKKWGKSNASREKSITSQKDASDLTALDSEIYQWERFGNTVDELERKLAFEIHMARERNGLDKRAFAKNIQEAAEVPCKSEDMPKRLNYLIRKRLRNVLKPRIGNQMENCYVGIMKARFREEILSFINELKGYVQGAIDPLPLARNNQFRSVEINDEMRRHAVMIIKEYTNSMLPKLEEVIDEFVDSACDAVKVIDYDKEQKAKRAFEILGVSEKDLSTARLKTEMKQYYNALEIATKNKSQMNSCQNSQRSKNELGDNMPPLKCVSSLTEHEESIWGKASERPLPAMPKLATPTSDEILSISKEANKSDHPASEKLKNPHSDPPVKLSLNQEQMNCLSILKSEL